MVNPIIRPLVEEIVRKRPSNIASFINEYSFRLMSNLFISQIKATTRPYTQILKTNPKKLRLSFTVPLRKRKRRNRKRRRVVKASALKPLANITSRLNTLPNLFPKMRRPRHR
jgi:hypothetical protein